MSSEEKEMCPLCMEPMEADDLGFYPCDCRYQICRFCWTRIINEENGLCPACRKEYNSEKPASYKPVQEAEDIRSRPNRKRKEYFKKNKLNPEMLKVLPELRVVQPNLIFVVGLPTWISKDKDILKGHDYFGRYGKIFKVEINQNQTFGGPQGQPSFSAYITYYRSQDAMRSIRDLNQSTLHGRPIRVSLGTTKYCSQFLRGTKCTKHECMYLHELGDAAASFTKEEMQVGKHTEYMNKLLSEYSSSSSNLDINQESYHNSPLSINGDNASPSLSASKEPDSSSSRGRSKNESNLDSNTDSSSTSKSSCRLLDRSQSQPNRAMDFRCSRNAPVGEGRKAKHYDKGLNVNYSNAEHCIKTSKINHDTSNKHGWNQSDYSSSSSKKDKSSYNTFVSKRFNHDDQSRKPHSSNDEVRINQHTVETIPSNNVNGVKNWCKPVPVNSSLKPLGEEPVDIDFDPFRESQQGLAELLAAEVAQLNVSKRPTNHSNGHVICGIPLGSDSSNHQTALDGQPDVRNSLQLLRSDCPWLMNFNPTDCDHRSQINTINNLNPDIYSALNPPPGFEETLRGHQHTTESLTFPNSNDARYANSSFSCSDNIRHFNNNNLSGNSSEANTSSFVYNPSALSKPDVDMLTYDTWGNTKMSNHITSSNANNMYQSLSASTTDMSGVFCSDASVQTPPNQLAQLFAAAFNTASAMLNNGTSTSNDKSTKPSSFDLSLFFNQLCQQSSLFSSLNNQAQSRWPGTPNLNKPNNVNSQREILDPSANPSSLSFLSCKPGVRSGHSQIEDHRSSFSLQQGHNQDRMASKLFQDNGFPSLTSESVQDPSLSHTASSLSWQLDDPVNVSGRISSPNCSLKGNQSTSTWKSNATSSDLLQQIWRNGSFFQPFFDQSMISPYGQIPQPTNNKGLSPQNCDTMLQTSYIPRSTE